MKIGFLVWDLVNISGGTKVIVEHAWGLQKCGHQVALICVTDPPSECPSWHPKLSGLRICGSAEAARERFDFLFATWWRTFFHLWKFESEVYGYLNQSLESRLHSETDLKRLSRLTYSMPLLFVTEAQWLMEFIRSIQPEAQIVRVPNGLSREYFPCVSQPETRPSTLRILVEGPWGFPFKGVADAFDLLQAGSVDLPLQVGWLTSHSGGIRPAIRGKSVEVFERVQMPQVHQVLRKFDLLLKLSTVEGVFGPPLEMFSQGGTAISYIVSGASEYMVHGVNSLLVEPFNRSQILRYLKLLVNAPQVLAQLRNGALQTARQSPEWEKSTQLLLQHLAELRVSGFRNSRLRPALRAIAVLEGATTAPVGDSTLDGLGKVTRALWRLFPRQLRAMVAHGTER